MTDEAGRGIDVRNSKNEDAELNIKGDSSSTLNVNAKNEAIYSAGDVNISGEGTIDATSATDDGIEANGGNLTIKGSGTVTGTGASDGIRAGGDATIDGEGKVVAKATEDQGLDVDGDLTIKGGAQVEASSEKQEAIDCDGNIDISGGAQVEATAKNDTAVSAEGSVKVENATLTATGAGYGIYAYKNVNLDHATVTVRVCARFDQALGIFTDEDDITIKNGSLVDVLATGNYSSATRSLNYANSGGGGHIYISGSVVKAIARYAKGTSDAPNPYVSEIDPDEGDKDGRMNTGILAATNEGVKPAIISIVRSKVTAEGDTAAILAVVTSTDGKEMGTIEIKDASVLAPVDGKVIDYHAKNEHSVGDTTYTTYNDGQLIGTGDVTVSDLDDPAVAKSAVIGTEDEQKPTPKPDEKPGQQPAGADGQQNLKPATYKAPAATKPATATKNVPATGDASVAGAAATGLGGIAALLAGLVARRKRQ